MAVCPNCGHGNADGAKFCSECGAKLDAPTATRQVRKTVTGARARLDALPG